MLISDWSSDVCSSDLTAAPAAAAVDHDPLAAIGGDGRGIEARQRHQARSGDPCLRELVLLADVEQRRPALAQPGVQGRRVDEFGLRSAHAQPAACWRSEEHTSELQSLMRISYAVFCLQKK